MNLSGLQIVLWPDPILKTQAKEIDDPTSEEVRLVSQRMVELMNVNKGIGLAAPQIGLPWRLFVINPTMEPNKEAIFINPVIIEPSKNNTTCNEGCLSLPGIIVMVDRPAALTIMAYDLDNNYNTIYLEGQAARVWQHEHDHLNGKVILDYMDADYKPIDYWWKRT